MVMDLMKLVGSPEAERLISTVKRQMENGLTIGDVTAHLDRLERASQRTGKTIKQVCDEAMNLYEGSI